MIGFILNSYLTVALNVYVYSEAKRKAYPGLYIVESGCIK